METKTQTKLEKLLKLAKEKGASQAEVIQMSWTDNPIAPLRLVPGSTPFR